MYFINQVLHSKRPMLDETGIMPQNQYAEGTPEWHLPLLQISSRKTVLQKREVSGLYGYFNL